MFQLNLCCSGVHISNTALIQLKKTLIFKKEKRQKFFSLLSQRTKKDTHFFLCVLNESPSSSEKNIKGEAFPCIIFSRGFEKAW
jgi:hypothetical protein